MRATSPARTASVNALTSRSSMVGHELRPRLEAGLAGHGELRVGELERPRRRGGVGADRADARERRRIAVTRGAEQILGELVLLFEIDGEGG